MKNPKVVIYSLLALAFLALSFLVNWMFILGSVVLIYLNSKEMNKN